MKPGSFAHTMFCIVLACFILLTGWTIIEAVQQRRYQNFLRSLYGERYQAGGMFVLEDRLLYCKSGRLVSYSLKDPQGSRKYVTCVDLSTGIESAPLLR